MHTGNLTVDKPEPKEKFAITGLDCMDDHTISSDARLLYFYLSSKPLHWDVKIDKMATYINKTERYVQKCLAELEERGFLVREKQRANGKYGKPNYHLNTKADCTTKREKGMGKIPTLADNPLKNIDVSPNSNPTTCYETTCCGTNCCGTNCCSESHIRDNIYKKENSEQKDKGTDVPLSSNTGEEKSGDFSSPDEKNKNETSGEKTGRLKEDFNQSGGCNKKKDIYVDSVYKIFNHWNENAPSKCIKITGPLTSKIIRTLKHFSLEDIISAIDNYTLILKNNERYWYSHKMCLSDFLERGNPTTKIFLPANSVKGFQDFLSSAKPFERFKKSKYKNDFENMLEERHWKTYMYDPSSPEKGSWEEPDNDIYFYFLSKTEVSNKSLFEQNVDWLRKIRDRKAAEIMLNKSYGLGEIQNIICYADIVITYCLYNKKHLDIMKEILDFRDELLILEDRITSKKETAG